MSRAKKKPTPNGASRQNSSRRTPPRIEYSGPWQPLAEPEPEGFLARLRAEMPPLYHPPNTYGRRTKDGVEIRGDLNGVPATIRIHSQDPHDLLYLAYDGSLGSALQMEFLHPAAVRFSRYQPRGKSGKTAALVRAIRHAAWWLRRLIEGELQSLSEEQDRWYKALCAAAKREEVDLSVKPGTPDFSVEPDRPVDPIMATAYAIARFSGIPWAQEGLRSPIDADTIDREYFLKLYGPLLEPLPRGDGRFGPTFPGDGTLLLTRIIKRLNGQK